MTIGTELPSRSARAGVRQAKDRPGRPPALLRAMLAERIHQHRRELAGLTMRAARADGTRHYLHDMIADARRTIVDSTEALRRMSAGTYGTCQSCRSSIPLGRLRLLPHARYCTPCQQTHPL